MILHCLTVWGDADLLVLALVSGSLLSLNELCERLREGAETHVHSAILLVQIEHEKWFRHKKEFIEYCYDMKGDVMMKCRCT